LHLCRHKTQITSNPR